MAWPDAVQLVIAYLEPQLAPVPVASRVPESRPTRFAQVRRVGGTPLVPVRDQARLDVFCWDDDEPGAMALALEVRELIWALAGTDLLGPMVYRVEETLGPRQDDDEMTGTPRVWATYSLAIRADEAIHFANPIGS